MKKIFYLLAILPLFLVSCSKEEDDANSNIDNLVGTWKAAYAKHVINGNTIWTSCSKYTVFYIEFYSDYTYKRWQVYSNGNTDFFAEGTYKFDGYKISFINRNYFGELIESVYIDGSNKSFLLELEGYRYTKIK